MPPGSAGLLRAAGARWAEGDLSGALELAGLAEVACRADGRAVAAGRALRLQADVLLARGEVARAAAAYQAAREAFAEADGATADLAGCDAGTAACLRHRGHLQRAADLLAMAAAGYQAAGLPGRAVRCEVDRAVVLHASGDRNGAIVILGEVLRRPPRPPGGLVGAVCHFNLGVALLGVGRVADAEAHLREGCALFEAVPHGGGTAGAAACNQNLGVLLHQEGRFDEARAHLWAARRGWIDLGRSVDQAHCDHNLAVVLRALGDHHRADRFEQLAGRAGGPDAARRTGC